MKKHSTNYFHTFIEVAEDCGVPKAEAPPSKEPKTAAQIEYEMLFERPYEYSSDDVLYESNGARRCISRDEFFAKGQPCFRASALTKRYGWGVHSNEDGKIALYAIESDDYKRLSSEEGIKHLKAMRSNRK
jgi:hypothetical protein